VRNFGVLALCLLANCLASAAGIVERSDIILQRANIQLAESMPLGNGTLGLALWSAEGLTIQLNRADTLPGRLSPGQVVLSGLTQLTSAHDYSGRLKLNDGEFVEQGNGMTAIVYVQPDNDVVVIDVTGADPKTPQTALLKLWKPRQPLQQIQNNSVILAETWKDTKAAGASGMTFGSLAAMSVQGESAHATTVDALGMSISFLPHSDGSFRVFIAAPHWTGGNAIETAKSILQAGESTPPGAHKQWWNSFWSHTGLFQMTSEDGSAEYLENLRLLYLFTSAAENGGPMPGSQAGLADLFSPLKDDHKWDPAAYWHFNLRMQVAANLGAGLFELNNPYFNLYSSNLTNIEQWTKTHMRGLPGACVPETMRVNGQGYENEDWIKTPGLNCDAASPPYYNARTLSTGAEVSQWIWRQYLATDDRKFLAANYPVMAASARFLLAYSQSGSDGKRHTFPTNAHENEWDVKDSTNDICAMQTLFPELMEAAKILGRDHDLANQAQTALLQIPELPVTSDAIGQSYTPNAEIHNTENVGLEPVWPYGLIGDQGPMHDLGVRTYRARPNVMQNDWSFDPLQAARLGLADDVKDTLIGLTKKYQSHPSGLASFIGDDVYVEQIGVVAAALQEALVQDYDGVLRILPAWPKEWDVSGTVFIQHKSKVTVQQRGGVLGPVVIDAGFTGTMHVRDPWSGKLVDLSVESGKQYVLPPSTKAELSPTAEHFKSGPRFLGERSIGLSGASATVTQIDPNLLLFKTSAGNVVASVGDDGALLVGTPSAASTPEIGRVLADKTHSAARYVVIFPQDLAHSEGDAGWVKLGAFVAMHENALDRLGGHAMGASRPLPDHLLELGVDRPRVAFSEVLTFDLNGDSIHVVHQPAGYSNADAIVHFHTGHLIYMGEVFPGDGYPQIDTGQGGKLDGLLKTLSAWTSDKMRVVPARGKMTTGADVQTFRDMIVTVRDRVKARLDAGKTEQQILAEHPAADFDARWGHGRVTSDAFVHMLYNSLKN
jgi:alpha-L-fucosidase 2